jgi:glutathione S-transferase
MSNSLTTPILYSFRRCPYCMRAHMALKYAGLKIILREVELSDLPAEVLAVSPHATVPALVISENEYMDESSDIVKWAVQQNDPENWLGENNEYLNDAEMLVETNDYSFKEDLDHYKYADRHPEQTMEYYRQRCEEFLEELNEMLEQSNFLLADHITIADIAVFPFIRQFAMVDKQWFDQAPYPELQRWLDLILNTEHFSEAFKKHEIWKPGSKDIYL